MAGNTRAGGFDAIEPDQYHPDHDPEPGEERVHLTQGGILNDVDTRARVEGADFLSGLPWPGIGDKLDMKPLKKGTNDPLDYSPDDVPDAHEVYTDQNEDDDHPHETEDHLDDILALHCGLMDDQNETAYKRLAKSWSDEARLAAQASRRKATEVRSQSQKHTGLKHNQMTKQGFIRTENFTHPAHLAAAKEYNNSRANFLGTRKQFIGALTGRSTGNLKTLGSAYREAGGHMAAAGLRFRAARA